MTSDNEETTGTRSRVILLDGHDNYKEWLCYVHNLLNSKDLYGVADGSERGPASTDPAAWCKQDKKAHSLLDFSHSERPQ